MYPTPVWGLAGVPGYGAGPFVPSGYKWTARTTELHPDEECKHRPPQRESQGEGTRASVKDLPPRPTHHSRVGPGKTPGKHRPKRRGKEKEGGGHTKGRGDTPPPTDPGQGQRGTAPGSHSRGGRGATTHSPRTHTGPPNQAQKSGDRQGLGCGSPPLLAGVLLVLVGGGQFTTPG